MQRPDGEDQVPSTFDWGLWLGPAPMRPYVARWPQGHYAMAQVNAGRPRPDVYHTWNFRGWWDFGTGALGDMGCHHLNTPFRALKLEYPTRVHATASRVFDETAPLASIVTYDFPARGDLPPVRLVWYDGGVRPPCPKRMEGQRLPGSGELYVGEDGVLFGNRVFPASGATKLADVPKTLPRRSGIWGEWWEACHGGERAGCHFEWAGLLTECVLLGNIAIRIGKELQWDAQAMRFTNDEAANKLVKEEYRSGWSL